MHINKFYIFIIFILYLYINSINILHINLYKIKFVLNKLYKERSFVIFSIIVYTLQPLRKQSFDENSLLNVSVDIL